MKLPRFSLRELFLLVVIAAMGCGWWWEHRASSRLAERNRILETWVLAAKDAGWIFAQGKGDSGSTVIVLPPK